jgi:hypothetical protein
MRSAHITRRQAEAAFGGLDADVSALQEGVAMRFDVDGRHGIDEVVESVELVLTAEEQAEMFRFLHGFTDQRRARRTNRRAGRSALRSLSAGVAVAGTGEAA